MQSANSVFQIEAVELLRACQCEHLEHLQLLSYRMRVEYANWFKGT